MTTSQTNALQELAVDCGLEGIPDEIDIDRCECEMCFDEAANEVRWFAGQAAKDAA